MGTLEALLSEYNNLWQEKIMHKESIRKFHNYISYLVSMASLALTFRGVSATDFFNTVINNSNNSKLIENASDIVMLLFVPFTPIVLVVLSFAINDLFQVYVIGTQIGNIEQRINSVLNSSSLSWEHRICPVIYGSRKVNYGKKIETTRNLIRLNDYMIFFPFVAIVCILTSVLGTQFIYNKFPVTLFAVYIGIIVYLLASLLWIG